jgi:hypothetical protein
MGAKPKPHTAPSTRSIKAIRPNQGIQRLVFS